MGRTRDCVRPIAYEIVYLILIFVENLFCDDFVLIISRLYYH